MHRNEIFDALICINIHVLSCLFSMLSDAERIDDRCQISETRMLLKRIDEMAEVPNLLLDRLNICNSSDGLAPVSLQEASPCANCSRFDHIELDCPVMAIQGQDMFRQGPSRGLTQ